MLRDKRRVLELFVREKVITTDEIVDDKMRNLVMDRLPVSEERQLLLENDAEVVDSELEFVE